MCHLDIHDLSFYVQSLPCHSFVDHRWEDWHLLLPVLSASVFITHCFFFSYGWEEVCWVNNSTVVGRAASLLVFLLTICCAQYSCISISFRDLKLWWNSKAPEVNLKTYLLFCKCRWQERKKTDSYKWSDCLLCCFWSCIKCDGSESGFPRTGRAGDCLWLFMAWLYQPVRIFNQKHGIFLKI